MTLNDLLKAIAPVLPELTFGEDFDGQLIIYTNLQEDADGNLVPFEAD